MSSLPGLEADQAIDNSSADPIFLQASTSMTGAQRHAIVNATLPHSLLALKAQVTPTNKNTCFNVLAAKKKNTGWIEDARWWQSLFTEETKRTHTHTLFLFLSCYPHFLRAARTISLTVYLLSSGPALPIG